MAMAHGMAVVSTPTHHALELLYDSAGLLIPYNDPNGTALAEALNALLSSATSAQRHGDSADPGEDTHMTLDDRLSTSL